MQLFTFSESWRVFRVMAEWIESIEFMASVGPSVSIFGSARVKSNHKYYKLTEKISRQLAEQGISVITGGGPGLMEAANKGAITAKGKEAGISIGLNIQLPYEQKSNPFVKHLKNFHYFFIRKVMFVKYAKAVIIMPGGYGTMDEFFEVVTLVQTKKIERIPLILVGEQFWSPLLAFFRNHILELGLIEDADLDLFTVVDTAEEAVRLVMQHIKSTTPALTDNIKYMNTL